MYHNVCSSVFLNNKLIDEDFKSLSAVDDFDFNVELLSRGKDEVDDVCNLMPGFGEEKIV